MEKKLLHNKLSVVIPVYNSEATLAELISRIDNACQNLKINFEIIAVDDFSSDDSWQTLIKVKKNFPRLRCVRLVKNFGQANATMAGIYLGTGQFIATIDDDLQYDPEDIGLLYSMMVTERYKVVCGYTTQKQHKEIYTVIVKLSIFFLRRLFLPRLKKVRLFSSFKIYKRTLFFNGENARTSYHIFHLWKHRANECASITVNHHTRNSGKSGYGFLRLIKHFKIAIIYMLKMTTCLCAVVSLSTAFILSALSTSNTPMSPFLFAGFIFLFLYACFAIALNRVSKATYTIAEII